MDEQQFDGVNGVIWSEANLTGLEIYSSTAPKYNFEAYFTTI